MGEIERWQRSINKPVVFTECGYCSADLAAVNPWTYGMNGEPNPSLQSDCYRAVLETFWNKPWFSGIYWWAWDTSEKAGGIDNIHFTPQNKPALELVRSWYLMPKKEEAALCDTYPWTSGAMAFFVHALTIFHNISKYVIIISPNIC